MALSACSAEGAVGCPAAAVAIAGHVARGTASERAAGNRCRRAAMACARTAAITYRGIVATVASRRTAAVVHRRIVTTVAVGVRVAVAIVVAPAAVAVVMVAVAHRRTASIVVHRRTMSLGRVGLVEVVSGIEAAASVAVATLEGHEHCGTVEEHPSDTVAGVDGERPATSAPDDGTVEPLTGHEAVVLPGAEHITQVAVANFPPKTEHVGAGIYVEQVVEVNLIHCLILCRCQSELVGHLVREEEGLVASGIVRHCCGGHDYRHHHHQGHHLLHVFYVLMVELFFPFLDGKIKAKITSMKRILPKPKGWFP